MIENIQPQLEKIFDTKVEFFHDEGVLKINIPRLDKKVSVHNWPLHPFMGISSWISFQKSPKNKNEMMAMGDLILFENEVDAAISTALKNNIKKLLKISHSYLILLLL